MAREGILFTYGNPLLDISAEVDEDFLKKYDLAADNAILAEEKHQSIFSDMEENYGKVVEYVPGGAAQNSVRVAQWLIGSPKGAVVYTGCIKDDKYGKILAEKTKTEGVNTKYVFQEAEPTGTCAVLVTGGGKHRSLVANLAAANCFKKENMDKPDVWGAVEEAQYYYLTGFPLTVSPESMLAIAEHASANNKVFCMNLSAPFLCQFFKEKMMAVIPHVDILFGNETEAATFSKENNFGTEDIAEIAKKTSALPKSNSDTQRIVVFTQGAGNTVVAKGDEVREFPVIGIDEKDIVDTNGAGDAFVGGYLAQLVQGKSLDECIRCAHYAANVIIQQAGCSLPEKHSFK